MTMAKPKTEMEQGCPSPPYTRWDQRVKPVLLSYLKPITGKRVCLSLQTQAPDIAKRHMRLLVGMLVYKGRLSPVCGAAKVYGSKGGSSRLKKLDTELRQLKTLSDAEYGPKALATAKRRGCPVGIIHHLAGRKPVLSPGTFNTRRMRDRQRGRRMPMGNTWEHHAQGGKGFFWNRGVLTARIQINRETSQWPLKVNNEEQAETLMAPIRAARQLLHQAALEELKYEVGTDEALAAVSARKRARALLASAIIAAGGPEKLAQLVSKGPQEEMGSRVAAPRRRPKSNPALERARGAIQEVYPQGVPAQAVEPNANLCRRASEKLREAGLPNVSDDTILRAAGRRK
jgi:hypothetical protein